MYAELAGEAEQLCAASYQQSARTSLVAYELQADFSDQLQQELITLRRNFEASAEIRREVELEVAELE